MLKALIGYFQNIKKKKQPEMKVTLVETEKNLQGTNSGWDEVENQISDLEQWKGKQHSIRTARSKKNPKKLRTV